MSSRRCTVSRSLIPYRWLEDPDDPETVDWVERQNEVSEAYLASLPERPWFVRTMSAVLHRPRAGVPFCRGGRYVVARNDGHTDQDIWYVADSLDELRAGGRVLVDPNRLVGRRAGVPAEPDHLRRRPVRRRRGERVRERLADVPPAGSVHRRGRSRSGDHHEVLLGGVVARRPVLRLPGLRPRRRRRHRHRRAGRGPAEAASARSSRSSRTNRSWRFPRTTRSSCTHR